MSTSTSPDWTPGEVVPPEGTLVDAIRTDGKTVRLKFSKGLWFFEDMSMYVYFVPQFYRPVEEA